MRTAAPSAVQVRYHGLRPGRNGHRCSARAALRCDRRTQRVRQDDICPRVPTLRAGIVHFVNADLIAAGLSPFRPSLVALSAGRLLLRELDRLASGRSDFAFESTLSGPPKLDRTPREAVQPGHVFTRGVLQVGYPGGLGAGASSGFASASQTVSVPWWSLLAPSAVPGESTDRTRQEGSMAC